MFIHFCSSLKNHTRFQNKKGKMDTRFQTGNGVKALPFGAAYTSMAYIGEYPPDYLLGPLDIGTENLKSYLTSNVM